MYSVSHILFSYRSAYLNEETFNNVIKTSEEFKMVINKYLAVFSISSKNITYYLKYYDMELSNEELLKDYLEYTLNEEDGKYQYLDKHTFEYIDLDDEMVDKAKKAFMERLEKRRLKESKEEVKEATPIKNNVVSFSKYKNKK